MGRRLDELDLSLRLSRDQEAERLAAAQTRLTWLRLSLGGQVGTAPRLGPPLCVVFEGWDASGKGGCIRRLVAPLDPRHVRVASFAAPTYDEKRHHFLWRFWPQLPGWGGMAVLDRSWYGRVLVERVEGFATEDQWRRAYQEICEFERTLVDDGMILVKFWLHLSEQEQLRRFERRPARPAQAVEAHRRGLAQPGQAPAYEDAVEDMLERTDTAYAPWSLVEGDSKRWARVKVVETVIAAIEDGLRTRGLEVPPPPPRWCRSCTSDAGNQHEPAEP
jgi:polyphosphate kinase 2 (PPK2 family)